MTEQIQPRDRGRYSFKQQGAPTIELNGATPLPELPASVGTPEVGFYFEADKAVTHVTVGGSTMKFWKDDDGEVTNSTESGPTVSGEEAPWGHIPEYDDYEQTRTWAEAVHGRIETATSGMDANGIDQAYGPIIDFATGQNDATEEPEGAPLVGVTIGQPREMTREELVVTGQAVENNPALSEVARMMHHHRADLARVTKEMDRTLVNAAVITAKEIFPGAKELRMRTMSIGDSDGRMTPTFVRTANDEFIGARFDKSGNANWASRPIEGADPGSIDDALNAISPHSAVWHEDSRVEYDPSTDETVIYLDGRRSSAHTNG